MISMPALPMFPHARVEVRGSEASAQTGSRPGVRATPGWAVFVAVLMGLCSSLGTTTALAQRGRGGFGFGGAVGGISIDADGIVRNLEGGALESLAQERRKALGAEPSSAAAGPLRKVSLARVVAAVEAAATANAPLPAEVLLLGGLERITYVFVDPEGHDIVLAGPADRPVVGADGTIVGAARGRPLLQLEDFVVALRAIDKARAAGMRCSIDPNPQGIAALEAFLAARRTIGPDPAAVFRGMEDALGPQTVTVGGVPADSRFAHVLVAADYRMKRIGMGLDPSGVKEVPSYLALVPAAAKATALPRFWLEADYDPIARDADELSWRFGGRRMKCLTEQDAFGRDAAGQAGVRRGQGKADPAAVQWCAAMTTHYERLAERQPVFAELQNCVDLAVVAALIHGRQLADRGRLDLGALLDTDTLPTPRYDVPKTVPTVASGIRKGTTWILSASGGVQFQPWQFAAATVAAADMEAIRSAALTPRTDAQTWWWD